MLNVPESRADMPAAFQAADETSLRGQRRAVLRTGIYLALLVVAALGGVIDWRVRGNSLNVGGFVSLAAFGAALAIGLAAAARDPEDAWYRGRAAAESVKTLVWRYAVCGDPFLEGDDDADNLFAKRVREVISEIHTLDLQATRNAEQITEWMRGLRGAELEDRMAAYVSGRIDDQCTWYSRKSDVNRRRSRQWSSLVGLATMLGVIAAALRALTIVNVDYLGVLAALGAAFSSWSQMRQHRTLATAYSVAAQELGLVKATLSRIEDEEAWARAVSDAEDAISREHTMWIARRSQAGAS